MSKTGRIGILVALGVAFGVGIGFAAPDFKNNTGAGASSVESKTASQAGGIQDYKFTNELGRAVSISDFRGQALAVTFFYSRCPVEEFCPRLAKNFQAVQQKLESMPAAPKNWHLISVSFDADFDSPATLKAYGQRYQYDPKRWSFLTGAPEKIAELARASGVKYERQAGTINHNFRTLIIDAAGRLQMVFPTGGDLSDQIVTEILKAAAVSPVAAR